MSVFHIISFYRYHAVNEYSNLNHIELRESVISQLPMIAKNYNWNWNYISPQLNMQQWMIEMNQDGYELDHIFLQLAAEVLHTRIILYNVVGSHSVTIEPQIIEQGKEIYLLYFEEIHFSNQGHYQSIVPEAIVNSDFTFKNRN